MNVCPIVNVNVCMCMERKSKLPKNPVLHVARQVQNLICGSGISLSLSLRIYLFTSLLIYLFSFSKKWKRGPIGMCNGTEINSVHRTLTDYGLH